MYCVLAYYHIGLIDDPQAEMERHKKFLNPLDFRGRIYISSQGINGQSSLLSEDAEKYIAWMRDDPRFAKIDFKIHLSDKHVFPKQTIKVRKQLVAIDCEVDFSKTGDHISPEEWQKKLEQRNSDTLVLDVRNDYEWEVGHFVGAELPKLKTFREFPKYAKELKEQRDPKKTSVMMCCTGGIRCEYFSAVLKQEGFEDVVQLNGGIIGYGLEKGSDSWEGKLFVFDDRLVVPLDSQATSIATCALCSCTCDVYYNCANMDCNELFICCVACLHAHQGCCCSACLETGRVRPYKEDPTPFRKCSSTSSLV